MHYFDIIWYYYYDFIIKQVKLESLGWRHYDSKPIELRGQLPYLEMVFYAQQL
jgi:hypothetical protein